MQVKCVAMPAPLPIGTRRLTDRGYVTVKVASGTGRHNDWRFEHRVVWEASNGPVPEGHEIHHRNEVRDDNRLSNLLLARTPHVNDLHPEALRERGRQVGLSNRGKPKPPEQRAKIAAGVRRARSRK